MKTLLIKKGSREVERMPLSKSTIFIGRAPTCDMILRSKEISAVHFVVDWFGEGGFDSEKGMWTIVDISHSSSRAKTSGEGQILSQSGIELSGFEFSIIHDDLAESNLKRGLLKRTIDEAVLDEKSTSTNRRVLEVVTYRQDIAAIENVEHIQFHDASMGRGFLPTLPQIRYEWKSPTDLVVDATNEQNWFQLYKRAEELALTEIKSTPLVPDEMYLVKAEDYEYYLRLVPEVSVKKNFFRAPDQTLLGFLIIFIGVLGLSFILPKLPSIEKKELKAERFAQVDVYEKKAEPVVEEKLPVPPPPPPEEEPKQAAAPPPEKIHEVPPKPAPEPGATKIKSNKMDSNIKPPKSNVGLNIKANQTGKNSTGLLSLLKSQSKGQRGQVKADQILQNRPPSETSSGNRGVIVPQTKMGALGPSALEVGSGGNSGKSKLSEASTSLKDSFVKSDKDSAVLARNNSNSLEGTVAHLKSKEKVEFLDNKNTEVQGGLDRDSVMRAIQENKVQIVNCYENMLSLSGKREAAGKITLTWKITPEGDVTNSIIHHTDFKNQKFEGCVKNIIDKIVFPKAKNKQPTYVKYPFLFSSRK